MYLLALSRLGLVVEKLADVLELLHSLSQSLLEFIFPLGDNALLSNR